MSSNLLGLMHMGGLDHMTYNLVKFANLGATDAVYNHPWISVAV